MLRNYLNIAWRNIRRNKLFALISIGGLVMGSTACLHTPTGKRDRDPKSIGRRPQTNSHPARRGFPVSDRPGLLHCYTAYHPAYEPMVAAICLPDIHQCIRSAPRDSHYHRLRSRNHCWSDYPIRIGQSGKQFEIGMKLTSS